MKMYYYEGSILPIEWTNQHGCGNNSKANCEIVIQYMCEDTADPQVDNFWPFTDTKNNEDNVGTQAFRSGDNIAAPRDGIPTNDNDAATDTIPDTEDAAIPDSESDRRYGMHESYDFYQLCQRTSRNNGLYTADQNVRRNDQRGTRQNPNGEKTAAFTWLASQPVSSSVRYHCELLNPLCLSASCRLFCPVQATVEASSVPRSETTTRGGIHLHG